MNLDELYRHCEDISLSYVKKHHQFDMLLYAEPMSSLPGYSEFVPIIP